jgi:aryl-alcohol dehydrogenase-like predicted oxidoreductase
MLHLNDMQYTSFGNTNIHVARLGYGAMGLGGAFGSFDEAEGIRTLLHYLEQGGNFIDTARHYGNSEAVIGKALHQWTGEKPFIATKIQSHGPDNTRWAIPPRVEDTFPRHLIRQNTEQSLRELGIEQIDLMQLHLYWPNWGTAGYWMDELLQLKEEGKIRYIGISLPDHRADVGLPIVSAGAIDAVQVIINRFDPLALDCLVPLCRQKGVAVIARCILDEGGLTGFLNPAVQFEDHDFRKTYFEEVPRELYMERVNALRRFVPSEAGTLARLAIKFVLANPGITTAIASMHVMEHLKDNLEAIKEQPLSDHLAETLRTKHRWVRNFYTSKYWAGINDLDKVNMKTEAHEKS